jgi:hypothetical protein
MDEFLEKVAKPGHLKVPLIDKKVFQSKPEKLWQYMEHACGLYVWDPQAKYLILNITAGVDTNAAAAVIGNNSLTDPRIRQFHSFRKPMVYDADMHKEKACKWRTVEECCVISCCLESFGLCRSSV